MKGMKGIRAQLSVGFAVFVGSLALVSVALGQSSSVQGYGGEGGGVSAGVGSGGGGGVASAGSLPFTGLDVGFLVLAGAAVLALGLVLRRAGRSQA